MSSVYKIGTTLATALDVSDIGIEVQNMSVDRATVILNRKYDEGFPTLLNSVGAQLTIYKDTTPIFTGTRANPRYSMRSASESLTVRLNGPWQWMETKYLLQVGSMYNAIGTISVTTPLIRVAAGQRYTFLNAIVSQLAGTMFQAGTVDVPTFWTPAFELRDATVAQAIRDCLQFCPDAIVSFDHSVIPPRIQISNSTSTRVTFFNSWDRADNPSDDFEHEDRHDLTISKAVVRYVRPYERITESYPASATSVPVISSTQNYWFEGEDFQGADGGNVFNQTVELSGTRRTRIISYEAARLGTTTFALVFKQRSSPFPLWPNLAPFFLSAEVFAAYPWLLTEAYGSAYEITAVRSVSEVANFDYSTNGIWWMSAAESRMPPKELWKTSGFNGFEVVDVDVMLTFRRAAPNNATYFQQQATARFTKAPGSMTDTVSREVDASDSSLEAVPTAGIAARLLSDNATVRAEGGTTILADEPIIPTVLQRKVLSPSGSTGIIQGYNVRLSAGSTTLSFGPPKHLRPDDLRNLARR